jgi:hypothetical protein
MPHRCAHPGGGAARWAAASELASESSVAGPFSSPKGTRASFRADGMARLVGGGDAGLTFVKRWSHLSVMLHCNMGLK